MSRLQSLFARKSRHVLNIYFTAGHPTLDSTSMIIQALSDAGVDIIEIGMPYSDPMADGPTIQLSSQVALANGMTLPLLLEQVKSARHLTEVPLVLMGYLNQVMQYGPKRFFQDAKAAGIDGLILPDLPLIEYQNIYRSLLEEAGLDLTFLITPQTASDRIRDLDMASSGFLYMVSTTAITGGNSSFGDTQLDYFKRIDQMNLNNPRLIGFGISDHQAFTTACHYAQGAIVGSAFIRALESGATLEEVIPAFVAKIRGTTIEKTATILSSTDRS